mgnify:CR=1 FL=1
MGGNGEFLKQLLAPIFLRGFHQRGGSGNGHFRGHLPGNEIAQQVGQEQKLICVVQAGIAVDNAGIQLREGVGPVELYAGKLKDSSLGHFFIDYIHDRVGAFVAVVINRLQRRPFLSKRP